MNTAKKIAITLRSSFSANGNDWAGMLYDGESCCFSKSYHLHIVDRVGVGTDAQMPEFTQSVSKPTPTKAASEKEFEPYKGRIRKSGTGCGKRHENLSP